MTATVWTITATRIETIRTITRFNAIVQMHPRASACRFPNRFYPAPSIEGTLLPFGNFIEVRRRTSLAPVGGVNPDDFPYPADKCELRNCPARRISVGPRMCGHGCGRRRTRGNGPTRPVEGSEVCEHVPTRNVAPAGTGDGSARIRRDALGHACGHGRTGTVFRRSEGSDRTPRRPSKNLRFSPLFPRYARFLGVRFFRSEPRKIARTSDRAPSLSMRGGPGGNRPPWRSGASPPISFLPPLFLPYHALPPTLPYASEGRPRLVCALCAHIVCRHGVRTLCAHIVCGHLCARIVARMHR